MVSGIRAVFRSRREGEAQDGALGPFLFRAEAAWYKRCAIVDREGLGLFTLERNSYQAGPRRKPGLRLAIRNSLSEPRCGRRLCLPGRAHDMRPSDVLKRHVNMSV